MRAVDMFSEGENVIYEHCGEGENPNVKRSNASWFGLMIAALVIITYVVRNSSGVNAGLEQGNLVSSFLVQHILPLLFLGLIFFIKFGSILSKQKKFLGRYYLTNKGIYIETGGIGEEQTEYIHWGKIENAAVCAYRERTKSGSIMVAFQNRVNYENAVDRIIIKDIPQCKDVCSFIMQQKEKWENHSEWEPDNNILQIAERTAASMPNAGNAHDLFMEEPTYTKESQEAFFGDIAAQLPMNGEAASFLEPKPVPSAEELFGAMPDDTIADLQAELFGTGGMQQEMYSDSSGNPLSVLSEPAAEQSFMGVGNTASPYALQQSRTGLWDAEPDDEMDSVEELIAGNDYEMPML